ncbi:hypothetical protein MSAN_00170700 [Mycena sanguinolenta]|uniref:Uncharacterized protein n=1 Tax=Mycena sanguinolenta TaxID=230812 RepID=A0A8H7DL54_9AGAR|nr:hypothetical protein MSAN_00170700 [Mycena sanguinolenta]
MTPDTPVAALVHTYPLPRSALRGRPSPAARDHHRTTRRDAIRRPPRSFPAPPAARRPPLCTHPKSLTAPSAPCFRALRVASVSISSSSSSFFVPHTRRVGVGVGIASCSTPLLSLSLALALLCPTLVLPCASTSTPMAPEKEESGRTPQGVKVRDSEQQGQDSICTESSKMQYARNKA